MPAPRAAISVSESGRGSRRCTTSFPRPELREGVEHRPGAARVGADGGGDAFLLRAPEERRDDLARQRPEDCAGPRREGVLALLADVHEAAPALRETSDRADADGERDEPGDPAQHHGGARRRRPAQGDENAGDGERKSRHQPEVRERARTEPAARELLHPASGAERGHRLDAPGGQPVVEMVRDAVGTGHDQREESARAGHERGRRIHGHRGRTEGDRVEGRQQRERGEPGAGRGAGVRLPQVEHGGGKHHGQQKHEGEHREAGQKLPRHQRPVAERQGHRELQGAVVVSGRPGAHRQGRDEHDRGPGQEQREEPHRRLVGVEEPADREDRGAHGEHEPEGKHPAHRGVEREPHLVTHHRGRGPRESGRARARFRAGQSGSPDRDRQAGETRVRAGPARRSGRPERHRRRCVPVRR